MDKNRENLDESTGDQSSMPSATMDIDERTEMLRQDTVKGKLAFTAQKNRVLYELCDDRSDIKTVQEAIEMMLEAQDTVIAAMSELSKLYIDRKELKKLTSISDEMESIYTESHQTQDKACKCVQGVCNEEKVGLLHLSMKCEKTYNEEITVALKSEIRSLREQIEELENILTCRTARNSAHGICESNEDIW